MLSLVLITLMSNFPAVPVGKIQDGDTFQVDIPDYEPIFGDNIPVRIQGIDTAERTDKRACAKADAEAAKAELKSMIEGQRVDLVGCVRDKYFRVNCRVYQNANDVGERLLKKKLAMRYTQGKRKWVCRH